MLYTEHLASLKKPKLQNLREIHVEYVTDLLVTYNSLHGPDVVFKGNGPLIAKIQEMRVRSRSWRV